MACRKCGHSTTKIHEFQSHYQAGIKKLDYKPDSIGPANRLNTSQRIGAICNRSDNGQIQRPFEPIVGSTKVDLNRNRFGRQMADDDSPVEVLNREVKKALLDATKNQAMSIAFTLAHCSTLSQIERKTLERKLHICNLKCKRYQ